MLYLLNPWFIKSRFSHMPPPITMKRKRTRRKKKTMRTSLEAWSKWLVKTVHTLLKCGANYKTLSWHSFCNEHRKRFYLDVTADDIREMLEIKLSSAKKFEQLLESKGCVWDSDCSTITCPGENTIEAKNIRKALRKKVPQQFEQLRFIANCQSTSTQPQSMAGREEADVRVSARHNQFMQLERKAGGTSKAKSLFNQYPIEWKEAGWLCADPYFVHTSEWQGAGPSKPNHSCKSAWPRMSHPVWQSAAPFNMPFYASPFYPYVGPFNANPMGSCVASNHGTGNGKRTCYEEPETSSAKKAHW